MDYPELINKSLLHVEKGSSVTLRCHVSSEGNPRLFWSWHCGKLLMEKEVTYGDTWSEMTFVASQQFNQRACYCRLRSMSGIIPYNKVSQKMFITIKGKKVTKDVLSGYNQFCLNRLYPFICRWTRLYLLWYFRIHNLCALGDCRDCIPCYHNAKRQKETQEASCMPMFR